MAALQGNGAPTKNTVGSVGDTYTDLLTDIEYELTQIVLIKHYEGDYLEYVWDKITVFEEGGKPGPQGPKGDKGDTGAQGPAGADGEDGGYYAPSIDSDGNVTWAASKSGMPQVQGANIKGPAGPKGDTGDVGPKGDTGDTGPQGPAGNDGANGVTFTPTINNGILHWTNDGGLPNPSDLDLSGLKVTTGSYVGTGVYGQSTPNTITVPDTAKVVFIGVSGSANEIYLIKGAGGYFYATGASGSSNDFGSLVWTDTTVKWWSGGPYNYGSSGSQMNASETTYVWVAIG